MNQGGALVRPLALLASIVLGGCDYTVAPVATQYPGETPARLSSSGEVVAPRSAEFRFPTGAVMLEGTGLLELAPLPLCEAARAVLGDALAVPFSCSGAGVVSIVHPSSDPASLMSLFVRTVERIGGHVVVGADGALVVTGPAGGEVGATGVGAAGLPGAALDGLEGFVVDGASQEQFQEAATYATYSRGGLARVLRDDIDAANAGELASELGLDLRIVDLGGASFVVGDEVSLAAFDAFSGLSERVVVPVPASGVSSAALGSFQSAYPAVEFSQDEASGSIYLAGLPQDVAIAVAALRQVQPDVSRVRIEGLFVSYETGSLARLEADLRVAASPFGLDGEDLGLSNGATLGLPFEVVLDQVKQSDFVQVVARPALTATFGLPAEFRSGGEVPVIGSTDPETGSETVEYRSVGITTRFTATPLTGQLVRLDLEIEVSSVAGSGVLDSPSFDVRSVSTVVDLRRGDTVLLSGLSEIARSSSRSRSLGLPSSAGAASDRSLGLFVTLR